MFGLFKQKDYRSEAKSDFESMVRQVRSAEPIRQAMVGRGITMAQKSFEKKYSKTSFQAAPASERTAFIEHIKKMEVAINQQGGPIALCSIGYGLFNRWLYAAATSDPELLQKFEAELIYFQKLAESMSSEMPGS